jgi:hypothetical protein
VVALLDRLQVVRSASVDLGVLSELVATLDLITEEADGLRVLRIGGPALDVLHRLVAHGCGEQVGTNWRAEGKPSCRASFFVIM